MAMAVAALLKNEFARIVLTRPAVEAGEKLGFLPGDLAEKVNPYLRPLYDALHDMVDFDRARKLHGARHHRGGAARLHARPHAQRLVRHPRRGAEHHARADEDVPHAARLRLEGGDHRRRDADRPAARQGVRPDRRARHPAGRRRHPLRALQRARRRAPPPGAARSSRPTSVSPSAEGRRAPIDVARGGGARLGRRARLLLRRLGAPALRPMLGERRQRAVGRAGRRRRDAASEPRLPRQGPHHRRARVRAARGRARRRRATRRCSATW